MQNERACAQAQSDWYMSKWVINEMEYSQWIDRLNILGVSFVLCVCACVRHSTINLLIIVNYYDDICSFSLYTR